MQQRGPRPIASGGFTLAELVVINVSTGILAALGGRRITSPIQGYIDLSRRAELVDAADNSLRRMQRDIRQALPNSIRLTSVGSVQYLELLHTVDGGLYRAEGAGDILDFTLADSRFDVLGLLDAVPVAQQQLVVYNIAATGDSGNAYSGDNRTTVTGGTHFNVEFAGGKKFPFQSPYQRFFLVDQAVSYVCTPSPTGGTLRRYAGYAIAEPQPTSGLGTGSLLANHVTACNFTYTGGSSQRAGLVTLQLSLADQGETISLLQQIHVDNAP
jgi:MSHA biogenesis protein MshO